MEVPVAYAINNSGVIAGQFEDTRFVFHAFIRYPDGFISNSTISTRAGPRLPIPLKEQSRPTSTRAVTPPAITWTAAEPNTGLFATTTEISSPSILKTPSVR